MITSHRGTLWKWFAVVLVLAGASIVHAQDKKGCEGVQFSKRPASEYSSQSLKTRIESNPQDVDALTHQGIALEEQGQFIQANALYEKAIKARPECYLGYYFAGLVEDRISGDEVSKAHAQITKAINLNPGMRHDPNVQGFLNRHANLMGGMPRVEKNAPSYSGQILMAADRFSIGLGVGILLAIFAVYLGGFRRRSDKS